MKKNYFLPVICLMFFCSTGKSQTVLTTDQTKSVLATVVKADRIYSDGYWACRITDGGTGYSYFCYDVEDSHGDEILENAKVQKTIGIYNIDQQPRFSISYFRPSNATLDVSTLKEGDTKMEYGLFTNMAETQVLSFSVTKYFVQSINHGTILKPDYRNEWVQKSTERFFR